jgi:hypothetical protein
LLCPLVQIWLPPNTHSMYCTSCGGGNTWCVVASGELQSRPSLIWTEGARETSFWRKGPLFQQPGGRAGGQRGLASMAPPLTFLGRGLEGWVADWRNP